MIASGWKRCGFLQASSRLTPLHEVKEELCFIEDNHWYGERNLLDLLNFASTEETPIMVEEWTEEEDEEGHTLYTDIMGSKIGSLTIGDDTRSLENILQLL
ncbi:unnamed protein product [Calypogeia fissa]